MGAAGSVVTNYLLTEFLDPREKDPVTGEDKPLSLEEQQARTNLVATIIGAIAEGAGLDTAAATTAAQIETENNDQVETENGTTIICGEGTDLVCTGKAIFISDYEQQPRNTIAYKNFADAAKQLDFDPANLTEDQRAIVNNVLAAHVFNEIPFKVFDNPEKTDALIAARELVLDARTNKPELYNQLLQEAGGNEVLAIYRAAVQDYYSDKPGEYGKDLTLGYLDPRDVLASIAGTGVGTGGKIIDDIGDLIGVILNPIDSTKQAIEAVKVILENPDQVIEQLGEEGEKYIDAVIGSYIGANDARALGDEGQVYEAQKQLGELVGAVVVETLVGGAITLKVSGKAVKIITNNRDNNSDNGSGNTGNDTSNNTDPASGTEGRANDTDSSGRSDGNDLDDDEGRGSSTNDNSNDIMTDKEAPENSSDPNNIARDDGSLNNSNAPRTEYIPPSPPENLPLGYTRNADNSIIGPSGGKAYSTGFIDNNGNVIYQRVSGGYYTIDGSGNQIRTGSPKPHGNTIDNTPTEIYRRVNDLDESYQKTGISTDAHRRYARDELGDDRIDPIGVRPRTQAVKIERFIVERWPGPLNKEPWAGRNNPNHPNYDPDYIPFHRRGK